MKRKKGERMNISSVDGRLKKRIRDIISESQEDGKSTPVVSKIVEVLLTRHLEYNRKPKGVLTNVVTSLVLEEKEKTLNRSMYQQPVKANSVAKKRKRPDSKQINSDTPNVRYSDLGGIDAILQTVREVCEYPLVHRNIYDHLGVAAPCGVLLHGPPGCGKTMLANAIAGELQIPFYNLSAPEIVSGMSGQSEEKIRSLFDQAKASAPCIIFLDEIDAVTGKRDNSSRGMERRIVAQLLTCMDSLSSLHRDATGDDKTTDTAVSEASESGSAVKEPSEEKTLRNAGVIVIGATNRPDALDAALRRAGRFDREISMGIPDFESRVAILKALAKKMRLSGDFDFKTIARNTPGFVGADLSAVCKEAAVIAVNRVLDVRRVGEGEDAARIPLTDEELASMYITMADFTLAIGKVQPSAKREGFATVPKISWDDIGALSKVQEELRMAISEPISNPEKFAAMGLSVPAGVLLYGPPGCGKTLLARAVANSSGANFISVKGPELLNKFVGESERAVRQVFSRARASSPCIVFFDELDSLCPKRSAGSDNNGVTERVVNQLLTEMDGLEERKSVFVIAATNRPDIIDPAMLRPGRLSKLLYVALPSATDRIAILKTCAAKTPMAEEVDLEKVAQSEKLKGFSGADIAALVREAAVTALSANRSKVSNADFDVALSKTKPSVQNHFDYGEINKSLQLE